MKWTVVVLELFECDQNLWIGANHAARSNSWLSASSGTGAALWLTINGLMAIAPSDEKRR